MTGRVTEGALLGGRVIYRQPAEGYRTGVEPVLLAASVPARSGERVLEAGTGAGAALLCLSSRCPDVACTGVEQDAGLAELARSNIQANGFGGASVLTANVSALPLPAGLFHHAIANPPWHDPNGPASPDARRDAAKRQQPGLLAAWAAALARCLLPRGTLTLIVSAAALPDALQACGQAEFGSPAVLPLWPRSGRPARLLMLQAVKGGRGDCRVLPGLVLHEGDGYGTAARSVLWDGAPLSWT